MLGISTIKLELCFKGYAVSKSTFDALFNGVARWIYEIVKKFEYKIVSSIRYGEILSENLIKSFFFSVLGVGIQLEKILKRL